MTKQVNKGGSEFYNKAKKQYENSAKPFIYYFSLNSEQPKPKKFRLLLGKFIEIFRENMRDQYRFDNDEKGNYWQQLQKNFSNTLEMSFIMKKIYQGKDVKLRIYFVLLLHTKKLFSFFDEVLKKMDYLYKNIAEKKVKMEKDIAPLSFFKDGQYVIQSQYITDFNHFREEEEMKKIMMQKDIKSLLDQIVEQVEINYRKYLEEQTRIRLHKEQEEQNRKALLAKKQYTNSKMQPEPKEPIAKPVEKKQSPQTPVQRPAQNMISTPSYAQLQLIRQRPRHLKNSQFLYNEKFKDERQIFSFHQKPEVSDNKTNCFQCQQPLSKGFYILGVNMNYCNYTGEWFCNDHIADQRIQIPYKAIQQFDLKGYYVSKRAYEQIKSYFNKAIIEIKFDDDVVKKNKKLYDFLILKRQLHLMYDSICNSEFIDKLFGPRINYCLKQNLFSLKNLYDIYNGHEVPYLQNEYGVLVKHFDKCEICQTKKGRICAECQHPPKIFSFQLRNTYSCKHCQKIFHRRCLTNNKCSCQES